jgi:UDP-N-acetyl-D-mannosaminuronate dehydrogenase
MLKAQLVTASTAFSNITKIAKGLLCLPSLLKQYKTANSFSITGAIKQIIPQLTDALKQVISSQIESLISSAAGTIIGPLKDLLSDLQVTAKNVGNFTKEVSQSTQELVDFVKNQQNCAAQGASIFNCVSQLVANNISKKTVRDNSSADSIVKKIQDETAGVQGVISAVTERELQWANKLRRQIQLQ